MPEGDRGKRCVQYQRCEHEVYLNSNKTMFSVLSSYSKHSVSRVKNKHKAYTKAADSDLF